jgi:hypothetical protein
MWLLNVKTLWNVKTCKNVSYVQNVRNSKITRNSQTNEKRSKYECSKKWETGNSRRLARFKPRRTKQLRYDILATYLRLQVVSSKGVSYGFLRVRHLATYSDGVAWLTVIFLSIGDVSVDKRNDNRRWSWCGTGLVEIRPTRRGIAAWSWRVLTRWTMNDITVDSSRLLRIH